jgi:hypothetical protein
MASTASALPALPPNTDIRKIVERINVLVRWFNRPDLFVPSYAADTGSGTAYATAPSTDIKFYEVGQEFDFKAATANTITNPTLNVNSLGAGVITKSGGAALAIGDIAANSFNMVIVATTAPTFELISSPALSTGITNTGATTFLTGDVSAPTANTFANGPNTGSIGANGQTWLITAGGSLLIGGSGAQVALRIHNGTAGIKDCNFNAIANAWAPSAEISVVVALSAATTFTLQFTDNAGGNNTTLKATGTNGTTNKATSITAVRIA